MCLSVKKELERYIFWKFCILLVKVLIKKYHFLINLFWRCFLTIIKFHGCLQENPEIVPANVTGEDGWEESFSGLSSIFIPAKEILSHSYNLNAAVEKNNVRFDDTYLDIINAAKVDISVGRNSDSKNAVLRRIQEMTHGTVVYDAKRDEFYLKNGSSRQEFNLVAEGIRKMALLWQLVKNGTLEKESVLFWDEPEANINPT